MTPKEKAKDLIFKFLKYSTEECTDLHTGSPSVYKWRNAKQCALIAVDELIEIAVQYEDALSASQTSDYPEFLKEVKQEIEKL
jgi:hypothetical protein